MSNFLTFLFSMLFCMVATSATVKRFPEYFNEGALLQLLKPMMLFIVGYSIGEVLSQIKKRQ